MTNVFGKNCDEIIVSYVYFEKSQIFKIVSQLFYNE